MIYLILNIFLSSFFVLWVKWVQSRRREDIISVGVVNYLVAGVMSAIPFFFSGHVVTANSIAIGGAMGSSYFMAYFFLIYAVTWKGAANTAVITRLSILLPIVVGIVLWGERPAPWQFVGVVLACVSLVLIGRHDIDQHGKKLPWYARLSLGTFFLIAGMSRLSQEAFRYLCDPAEKSTYLFSAFMFASAASLVVLVYRRRRVTLPELGCGFVLGMSNVLQSYFILKCLEHFDGFIVFPVTSAGGLVVTTVIATVLLGERLNRRSYMGIGVAVCALALLHFKVGSPDAKASLREPCPVILLAVERE